MALPNFLIIGAAKAGTTSLYAYLQQHPQIFLSTPKEPRFFALAGDTPQYQGPIQLINQGSVTSWEDYQALFAGASEAAIARGEASTIYLYDPRAVGRIRHYLPEAKLIAILRNPVDRAYSSYLHLVRDGQETLSFEAALAAEPERIRQGWPPLWHYQQRGYYYAQLKPYYDVFDPAQIKILRFEDLAQNPKALMQELFRFLGVSTDFRPDFTEKQNVSGVPKSQALSYLLNRDNPLKSLSKILLPQSLRKAGYRILQRRNTGTKTTLRPDTRAWLTRSYREDMTQLEALLGEDLSSWKTFEDNAHQLN
ncbi:sulfotransferase family protein [Lyngbya confervoides]|uniref:Sulfotransferase n=1 Tax=Lyngbya confervoides BDU141951 TaxID=1574623 RepID=A0ABD4SYN0_9CYAN|nr:sulfotransferase [Lyngbya confervoides]MCM1981519.1 sulfotransferase [Lyngbya confervoides BDU141951]